MNVNFKPLGDPSSTEVPIYRTNEPITLGERTNLWGTEIRRTEAPSNIIKTIKKYIIKEDDSVFDK